jgi:hypothetical protein
MKKLLRQSLSLLRALACLSILLCVAAFAQQTDTAKIVLQEVKNSAGVGSLSANLTLTYNNKLILSWLEPVGGGVFALKFARQQNNGWTKPQIILEQKEFIRHPAELPTVTQLADGSFVALWAQNKAKTRDGEDVYFSHCRDGKTWAKPVRVHQDDSFAEHGLVSLLAVESPKALLVWLDGRDEENNHRSFLMQRMIEANGKLSEEVILDADVCSCCPTALVRSGENFVLAYRDRSQDNIRDISILRHQNGKWSEPFRLHEDGWRLQGCPTNSVDLSADGERVVAAWFTGADDKAKVKIAFSQDAGATFGEPLTLNENFALGRASVALLTNGDALATWVETENNQAKVMLRRISRRGEVSKAIVVATGTVKGIGFPRIRRTGNQAILALIDSSSKTIRTSIVR